MWGYLCTCARAHCRWCAGRELGAAGLPARPSPGADDGQPGAVRDDGPLSAQLRTRDADGAQKENRRRKVSGDDGPALIKALGGMIRISWSSYSYGIGELTSYRLYCGLCPLLGCTLSWPRPPSRRGTSPDSITTNR